MKIDWNSSFRETKFIGYLLRMPLDGIFDLSNLKEKEALFFYSKFYEETDFFIYEGFRIICNPDNYKIKKADVCQDNSPFIHMYGLVDNGKADYNKYRTFMNKEIVLYRRAYDANRFQKNRREQIN